MKALSKRLSGRVSLITLSLLSLLWQLPVSSQQLTVNSDPIFYPKSKIQNSLPCLDSSGEWIEQLTQAAIANSPELVTLDEQIALVNERVELMGDRIDYR